MSRCIMDITDYIIQTTASLSNKSAVKKQFKFFMDL